MKKRQFRKIVVIGGGTGSYVLLSGLKKYPLSLNSIVAITDDGGSTGRLRDEFGFLPVGDMRQCIAALSNDLLLKKLLLYRFEKGKGLNGHNLGNLILTSLQDIAGSESKALQFAGKIFRIKGKIFPVSLKQVQLAAIYKSNKKIIGEHNIETNKLKKNDKITKLYTIPQANINPRVKKIIENADLIILGPGDLYGSTIANLVVKGIPMAIKKSKAKILYILNLMTVKSQTAGFTAKNHLAEIEKYLKRKVNYIIINNKPIPKKLINLYKKVGEHPVRDDFGKDSRVIRKPLLAPKKFQKSKSDPLKRSLLRHDSEKIAKIILKLI